jgi:hypothetical protein
MKSALRLAGGRMPVSGYEADTLEDHFAAGNGYQSQHRRDCVAQQAIGSPLIPLVIR